MKTDLELLQLAAKAAGYAKSDDLAMPDYLNVYHADGRHELFNSLHSLGDALSLAINLKMELKIGELWSFAFYGRAFIEQHKDNTEAAVCRLITRVAADAGEQMP